MSEEKKKGIYIESVRGGREVPTVAPPPTQRDNFTEGREVHRLTPTPPPAAPNKATPTPPPAKPSTPKE